MKGYFLSLAIWKQMNGIYCHSGTKNADMHFQIGSKEYYRGYLPNRHFIVHYKPGVSKYGNIYTIQLSLKI